MIPHRCNSQEMADRLHISLQAMHKHCRKWAVLPEADGTWDAKKVEESFATSRAMNKGQPSGPESASLLEWKTRLEEQRTRKLERENDIEEGRIILASDALAVAARVHQAVVNDILATCDAVGPRLEGLTVPAMIARLKDSMKDALRHIATRPADPPAGEPAAGA